MAASKVISVQNSGVGQTVGQTIPAESHGQTDVKQKRPAEKNDEPEVVQRRPAEESDQPVGQTKPDEKSGQPLLKKTLLPLDRVTGTRRVVGDYDPKR